MPSIILDPRDDYTCVLTNTVGIEKIPVDVDYFVAAPLHHQFIFLSYLGDNVSLHVFSVREF